MWAAAACTCRARRTSTSLHGGTLQANPGVNIDALRPYKGYNSIRESRQRRQHPCTTGCSQLEPPVPEGLMFGFTYTLSKSMDDASATDATLSRTPTICARLWGRPITSHGTSP